MELVFEKAHMEEKIAEEEEAHQRKLDEMRLEMEEKLQQLKLKRKTETADGENACCVCYLGFGHPGVPKWEKVKGIKKWPIAEEESESETSSEEVEEEKSAEEVESQEEGKEEEERFIEEEENSSEKEKGGGEKFGERRREMAREVTSKAKTKLVARTDEAADVRLEVPVQEVANFFWQGVRQ
ncbi:neurofilament medium polypeptide-like [Armigeres subalbatus]|uniref:neurofilament medium polypeptide-like n=1 Tax=Armigeres subalbatus TaxID=124917 RepID=UPI002ED39ADE